MSWSIKQTSQSAFRIDIPFGRHVADQIQPILLLADVHWDSAQCKLNKLAGVLRQAQNENAPVIIAGDYFDAMQGKWDPRSSQESLRPEHRKGCYLDSLVTTAAEWLRPFAKQIALISYGNHETSIKKRHEVDLLQRLVQELRREGSPVMAGPYWGFVRVCGRASGNQADSFTIYYHHGYGGGGEVTRGLIDWSRTRGQYFADVYFSGHIHRRNQDENIITVLTKAGTIKQKRQLFLRASSWKDESKDGWHVQSGRAGRPIGGWWLNTRMDTTGDGSNYRMDYVAVPT